MKQIIYNSLMAALCRTCRLTYHQAQWLANPENPLCISDASGAASSHYLRVMELTDVLYSGSMATMDALFTRVVVHHKLQ